MKDIHERTIDYARISVTERCNFRCSYCKPELHTLEHDPLSDEELLEIVNALAKTGVKYIKVTGGEPLVRKNIFRLIQKMKGIEGIQQVTLTTNGALIDQHLEELKGIDGINVSIDAMDETLFNQITGVTGSDRVLSNVMDLIRGGHTNIKINCVLIKGCNEAEYIKLIRWVKDYDVSLKFIEMMPIGHGREFGQYTLEELKKTLTSEFGPLIPLDKKYGNGPAQYYKIQGIKGKIGLIGAISHKFCQTCNRIRITSDGVLKTCLQYETGVDLKPYFHTDQMAEVIESAVYNKEECHRFGEAGTVNAEHKLMSQIGG